MEVIFVTFAVLNELRLSEVSPLQPENIYAIVVTFAVLNELRSSEVRAVYRRIIIPRRESAAGSRNLCSRPMGRTAGFLFTVVERERLRISIPHCPRFFRCLCLLTHKPHPAEKQEEDEHPLDHMSENARHVCVHLCVPQRVHS